MSVTFSEAVSITGTPQITLNIGGTEGTAEYSGAGTATGQLLFSYTVQPVDQDDDGIAVNENSLALNGGTIQATDDSANATLTHSTMTFANHQVDTELVLIGNMDQADGTALRINAGESIRVRFKYWDSIVLYEVNQIVLDVTTPSDTLTLTVSTMIPTSIPDEAPLLSTFTGSVASSGRQAFRSTDFTHILSHSEFATYYLEERWVEVILSASGTGFIELGTTMSTAEDAGRAYRWSIGDSVYQSTGGGTFTALPSAHLPRFNVIGHTTETLRILEAEIVSEPYNGTAYAAGENIEVRIILNGPIRVLAESLTVPLHFGEGAANRRDASQINISGSYHADSLDSQVSSSRYYVFHFAYAVQPGDIDADGVVLGADPLGSAADRKIEYAVDDRIKMDLSAPANVPGASHRVDGSVTHGCEVVHCAYVTAGLLAGDFGELAGFDRSANPAYRLGNLSGRLFTYGGQSYFLGWNHVYFSDPVLGGNGESEIELGFTKFLQERAIQRLGWQVGDDVFAFADARKLRGDEPLFEEHGFEQLEIYTWSSTSLRTCLRSLK